MLIDFKDEQFETKIKNEEVSIVQFSAEWCAPCKALIPVMEKSESNDGYEGAIVLEPKCDLYLDNPVACVDYASLYPSSMMSENLSHDSKVWTKEYDLLGKLISVTGNTDSEGVFIYDNFLPKILLIKFWLNSPQLFQMLRVHF